MTDQQDPTADALSRRRLLRVAGVGAGGLVLGAAGTAREVAATECPRAPDYWAVNNWPETGPITDPLEIVGERKRIANWKLFLSMDPADDAAAMMARQVLAARLNFQLRPADDPACVHATLPGDDHSTIASVKGRAREWLAASAWPDEQRGWVVDGVDGEQLWVALRAFNDRSVAELDCGCGAPGDEEQASYPVPTSGESARTSGAGEATGGARIGVNGDPWRPFHR